MEYVFLFLLGAIISRTIQLKFKKQKAKLKLDVIVHATKEDPERRVRVESYEFIGTGVIEITTDKGDKIITNLRNITILEGALSND